MVIWWRGALNVVQSIRETIVNQRVEQQADPPDILLLEVFKASRGHQLVFRWLKRSCSSSLSIF